MAVYRFPVNKAFLDVLAHRLVDDARQNPLAASKTLVILPRRRACRTLAERMQLAAGNHPVILPRIIAMGDLADDAESTHAVISPMERLFTLAKLCMAIDLDSGMRLTLPQALELAGALTELLDELQREQIDVQTLEILAPEDYAVHWQRILQFLRIITTYWPRILQDEGKQDPITHRNQALEALGNKWRQQPPPHKIIIAGSTASNLATAKLMAVVASMKNGEVILPALHVTQMTSAYWDDVQESHPHFFLKQFLERANQSIKDIACVDHPDVAESCNGKRADFLETAFLPAAHVPKWASYRPDDDALDGLRFMTFSSPEEEAECVAMRCQKALQQRTDCRINIVSESPSFTAKIQQALAAHDIIADASEGMTLSASPWAHFMQMIIEAAEQPDQASPFLALLKHPFMHLSHERKEVLQAARWIETYCFRTRKRCKTLEEVKQQLTSQQGDISQRCVKLLNAYQLAMLELQRLLASGQQAFATLWRAHQGLAERLAQSPQGDSEIRRHASFLYVGHFSTKLDEHADRLGRIDPAGYAKILEQLYAREIYRPTKEPSHRIRILPAAEAQMEAADINIIAGMNEGVWPKAADANPWMSRTMQSALGLRLPEVKASRMAHDLWMLMAAPEVICTRSLREDGIETQASRWLQRITACCHALSDTQMKNLFSSDVYTTYRQVFYQPSGMKVAEQPKPRPPAHARPQKYTITDVELLQRDPYAFYAKRILKLKPLEPLDAVFDAASFGDLVHDMLNVWQSSPSPNHVDAMALVEETLDKARLSHAERYLLQPKLLTILEVVMAEHGQRSTVIQNISSEKELSCTLKWASDVYQVIGRADRIEYHQDGKVVVVDFKTGVVPKKNDVLSHIASQLPLECLMLLQENPAIAPEAMAIEYWKLSGRRDKSAIITFTKNITEMNAFLQSTAAHITSVFEHYASASNAYVAVPDVNLKPAYHEYAALERYAEWV